MKPSARLRRNYKQLQLSITSSKTFKTAIRTADRDFLTLLCAIAIAYATQHIKSPNLLEFLHANRSFIHKAGDRAQSAAKIRALLQKNNKSFTVFKNIVTHLLLYVKP